MIRRRAFTVLEVLIAITTGALVTGGACAALIAQQRAYAAITERSAARAQLRDAADALRAVLTFTAPGTTLHLASDTAFEADVVIAVSVTCSATSGGTLSLASDSTQGGGPVAGFGATPDIDDILYAYVDSAMAWRSARITAVTAQAASAACDPRFASPGTAPLVTLGSSVGPLPPGTPVRVARTTRVSIYHGPDGGWYLGARTCMPVRCTAIQPVAGPFVARPASAPPFRYSGENGRPTTDVARVTRLDFTLATASGAIRFPGRAGLGFTDSIAGSVALRNVP